MRKNDEINDPKSCLNRACGDEMLFVLLGRDPAARAAIRAWISERIRLGKNKPDDPQIKEAEKCIEAFSEGNMERTLGETRFIVSRRGIKFPDSVSDYDVQQITEQFLYSLNRRMEEQVAAAKGSQFMR